MAACGRVCELSKVYVLKVVANKLFEYYIGMYSRRQAQRHEEIYLYKFSFDK